jgi:hypothetical protein
MTELPPLTEAKPLTGAEEHAETIREFIAAQDEPSDFVLGALAALEGEIARLIRGLEGAKDWAARSGATGLEQWCSEALSPTGKLATFPPDATAGDLISRALHCRELAEKDGVIKALADALDAHGARGNMNDPEWHSFHCIEDGHDAACEAARAALRLAGR